MRCDLKNRRLKRGQPASAENDAPVAEQFSPRIPPGEYDAICYKTETGRSWGGRTDIYILFRIWGGRGDGTELFMVCTYNLNRKLSPRYKYYQQWTLAKGRPPGKGERLSRKVFCNKMYRVLVRDTQRRHSNGKLMPDILQYSVVDSIIETQTGIPGHE